MIDPILVQFTYTNRQTEPADFSVVVGKLVDGAIVGRSIEVTPTPSAQITLDVAYYQGITTLASDSDTNWLLTYEPDLYLYTALLHAAPFLQDQQRATLFGTLLAQQVTAAVQRNDTVSLDNRQAGPSLNSPSDLPR